MRVSIGRFHGVSPPMCAVAFLVERVQEGALPPLLVERVQQGALLPWVVERVQQGLGIGATGG
jgi:hypothetical protein